MRGRVYSIRSYLKPELVYCGSTKETLSRRLAQHVKGYKSYLNGKQDFITSFKLIELGKFYIELVEIVEYIDKAQLHAVEGRHIRENNCVNKYQAGRSKAQYCLDNAVVINARHAQYDKVNAAAIKAQKSAKINCGCGSQHRTGDKAVHARTAKHRAWLETEAPGQAAL